MSNELVITSKADLEKMLIGILSRMPRVNFLNEAEQADSERLNQKQAAVFLGITEATLIRWKKQGKVPCQQLPGSSKVTYYKSQLKAALQRNADLPQTAGK
jgi:predicted DNA-binding transcriptional regulator AlpA